MSFNKGDKVRVGKRGVECVVTGPGSGAGYYMIRSEKTQRDVHEDRLILIEAASAAPEPVSEDRNDHRQSSYGMAILNGLQAKPLYEGTVSTKTIQNRRKAGKVQKQSRKANR